MTLYHRRLLRAALAAACCAAASAHADITYNYSSVDRDMGDWPPEDGGGPPWVWTNGDGGYTGNLPATWIATINNAGGIAYSETACGGIGTGCSGFNLGMGARAYKDGTTNWGHNADFGLFTLAHAADVTITVASDGSDLRPAFGLWSGWAENGSRHSEFLGNGALEPMADDPLPGSGLTVVDPNAWAYAATQGATGSASLTLHLSAGQYTLILGGYDGTTPGPELAYTATISAAPVPLPAAVWLFGAGLTGLGLTGRRRKTATSESG